MSFSSSAMKIDQNPQSAYNNDSPFCKNPDIDQIPGFIKILQHSQLLVPHNIIGASTFDKRSRLCKLYLFARELPFKTNRICANNNIGVLEKQ